MPTATGLPTDPCMLLMLLPWQLRAALQLSHESQPGPHQPTFALRTIIARALLARLFRHARQARCRTAGQQDSNTAGQHMHALAHFPLESLLLLSPWLFPAAVVCALTASPALSCLSSPTTTAGMAHTRSAGALQRPQPLG